MAHFVKVNSDGSTGDVIVISNDDCGGGDFPESEPIGQAFIASLGIDGYWLQTSYNGNFRGNYASGCRYDEEKDVFIKERPSEDFVLNTETWSWELSNDI